MTMTLEQFEKLAYRIDNLWGQPEMDEHRTASYFEVLQAFDVAAVTAAVEACMADRGRDQRWAPTCPELLAKLGADGTPALGAEHAPTLDELLHGCAQIAGDRRWSANPATGEYPSSIYDEIGWRLGESAMAFTRTVGIRTLLAGDYTPGSFPRRDLQRSYDEHETRRLEHGMRVALDSGDRKGLRRVTTALPQETR